MKDKTYLIFHLTKTAGTSLRETLYRYVEDWSTIFPYYPRWGEIRASRPFVLDEHNRNAKYFIGHLVYYGMHEVFNKPCQYILFLRDPFRRYVSLFNHVRIDRKLNFGVDVDFETWFQQYKISTMTRELSGGVISDLSVAKRILDNVGFIGLQETFAQDLKQLITPDVIPSFVNIGTEKSESSKVELIEFTKKQIEIIEEVLSEDQQLYEYALKLRAEGHNRDFTSLLDG